MSMARMSNYLTNSGCIHGTHKFGSKAAKGYKGLRQIEEADVIDKKKDFQIFLLFVYHY